MGTDGVIGPFPNLELAVELCEGERTGGDLIELLHMGAIGTLHLAVERGRAWGQHEKAQASLAAGIFEDGGELAAPPAVGSVVREDKVGNALPESYGFAGLGAAGVLAAGAAGREVPAAGAVVPPSTGFAIS